MWAAFCLCDRGIPVDGLPVVGEVVVHDLRALVVEVHPHIRSYRFLGYVPIECLRPRRGHVQDLIDPVVEHPCP